MFTSTSLNISDKARIASFEVINEENAPTVTRNELDTIIFTCAVSSKPASAIRIQRNKINVTETKKNDLVLNHTIRQSSCEDAGIYICLATNTYNKDDAVSRHIQYYVRCK